VPLRLPISDSRFNASGSYAPKSGAKFPVRPAEAALTCRFDDAFCPSRPRCHVRLVVSAEFSGIEGPLVSCRPRRGFVEVARERLVLRSRTFPRRGAAILSGSHPVAASKPVSPCLSHLERNEHQGTFHKVPAGAVIANITPVNGRSKMQHRDDSRIARSGPCKAGRSSTFGYGPKTPCGKAARICSLMIAILRTELYRSSVFETTDSTRVNNKFEWPNLSAKTKAVRAGPSSPRSGSLCTGTDLADWLLSFASLAALLSSQWMAGEFGGSSTVPVLLDETEFARHLTRVHTDRRPVTGGSTTLELGTRIAGLLCRGRERDIPGSQAFWMRRKRST
jgi:hypothetical protein